MGTKHPTNTLECALAALLKAAERTGDDHLKLQLERVIDQMHQQALTQRALEAVQRHDLAGFFGDMPLWPHAHESAL